MMKPHKDLPLGYRQALQLDLQTNGKLRYGIALGATLICLFMVLLGNYIQPVRRYYRGQPEQAAYIFLGILLYMILHEMVHGIFMWIFSGEPAHFKISMPFACTRSDIYFHKPQYLIIALAPLLIWGIALGFACYFNLQNHWFWTFYIIEIVNMSGAASDLYVVWKFRKLPSEILIHDSGTAITLYVPA